MNFTKRLPYIIMVVGFLGLASSLIYLVQNANPEEKEARQRLTEVEKVVTEDGTTWSANVQNNAIAVNTGKVAKQPEDTSISILMPGHFFNDAFVALGNKLRKSKKIEVSYQSIDDLVAYEELVKTTFSGDEVDIMLIPLDWLESLEELDYLKKVPLSEDVSNYVHGLFSYYASHEDYTLMPHALDPLVTYIAKSSNLQTQGWTMGKTLSYITLGEQAKSLGMPVLWGISKNDIRILEQNKSSFPNYFSLLYNMLYQFDQSNDIKGLDAMLQLSQVETGPKRDYVAFVQLIKKIQKRNQYCEVYPDTCLFAYKFANIKFGYLSDLIIWDKYFSDSNRTLGDVDIVNFPLSSKVYKVRGWAFVVNTHSNADGAVQAFFEEYLRAGLSNEFSLWDNVWSAQNAVFDFQKSQKKYQNILQFEPNFSLMYGSWDLQKDFLEKTQTLNLLRGGVSAKDYLAALKWER